MRSVWISWACQSFPLYLWVTYIGTRIEALRIVEYRVGQPRFSEERNTHFRSSACEIHGTKDRSTLTHSLQQKKPLNQYHIRQLRMKMPGWWHWRQRPKCWDQVGPNEQRLLDWWYCTWEESLFEESIKSGCLTLSDQQHGKNGVLTSVFAPEKVQSVSRDKSSRRLYDLTWCSRRNGDDFASNGCIIL